MGLLQLSLGEINITLVCMQFSVQRTQVSVYFSCCDVLLLCYCKVELLSFTQNRNCCLLSKSDQDWSPPKTSILVTFPKKPGITSLGSPGFDPKHEKRDQNKVGIGDPNWSVCRSILVSLLLSLRVRF